MIKLTEVAAGYGKKAKIKNITCEFEKGEITAVVGPNGSGKSTLVKSIVSLTKLLDGDITLDGNEMAAMEPAKLAQRIAYLPQNRNLPSISTEKLILHGRFPYLSYPRRYSKTDYQYVEEAMKKLGIENLRYREVKELSGGERQKVYLAMALAQNTEVLILDEPTTYLDIRYQLELLQILAWLKREGKTVIVVLHDLNAALQYADKLVVMSQGEIRGSGMPEQILKTKILDQIFGICVDCFTNQEEKNYYFFQSTEK